jgi:WD40 repeat protein
MQVGYSEAHGPGGRLSAMAFDANQRRLLTGGSDGMLRFWNANNGSVLREVSDTNAIEHEAPSSISKLTPARNPISGQLAVSCSRKSNR